MVTASISALGFNIRDGKIGVDQFGNKFGKTRVISMLMIIKVLVRQPNLPRVDEVGDDSYFLLSAFLNPSCHIELDLSFDPDTSSLEILSNSL